MKVRHILCIAPLLFVACSEKYANEVYEGPIGLTVGFTDTKAQAVADAYKDTIPSSDNPLMADVWFSTTKGVYKGTGGVSTTGEEVDVHTTISYYGPSITIPDPYQKNPDKFVHYPPYHGNIYCVGLYPQGAWTASTDGKTATAPINGVYDLMYANQKEGSDNSSLSRERQLYNHQLCWLKVRVRSSEHSTAETWGLIKNIKIHTNSTANVDFSKDEITYSGENTLTVFESEAGTKIPIEPQEFGSVMVAPVDNAKYYVDVECENHHRENVEVVLTNNEGGSFTGSSKGKVFVLRLTFQTLPTIKFTATLANWEDEGRSLEME